jgi:hypothetical protein
MQDVLGLLPDFEVLSRSILFGYFIYQLYIHHFIPTLEIIIVPFNVILPHFQHYRENEVYFSLPTRKTIPALFQLLHRAHPTTSRHTIT